ncbi:MAG: 4-alpha-glucanotransferase [Blautia sp.]|nr:4-alpha-glucanotransferase [Blautia sp.]
MRESGILFPVFSLPSRFGIGCVSKEAYDFVDFLEKSGQGFWQVLPVGPTGFGDSPYQPFSAFAGNPYFIGLEKLIEEGLLTWDECNSTDFGNNEEKVDYGALYQGRFTLLRKAYERFTEKGLDKEKDYLEFVKEEKDWLQDYALIMAIKTEEQGKNWQDWDLPYRTRKPAAIKKALTELADEIGFFMFQQYEFDRQWKKLHEYAASKNVKIIGDIPFYVAMDSADVWAHPEVFRMNDDLTPELVAGCPPDAFSATGQLWGNPVYDWDSMKKAGYPWWVLRMKRSYELYDVVRIDHFHGFCDYYAVPAEDETAENGELLKGPGMDLFTVLKKKVPEMKGDGLCVIAEDLGNVTKENKKLLDDSGFPGMKVLQFAFTSWDSVYMTHRHEKNSVVYTGTHDNPPTRAWLDMINDGERDYLRRYLNSMNTDYGALVWDFIREAYRSVSDLCIIPLQDYLVKGNESRINTPGTAGENWQWRLRPNFLSDDLAYSIRQLAETYSRIPQKNEGM